MPSLNSLRNCTSGANSEPYAADAMTQALPVGTDVTTTVVAVEIVVSTCDTYVAVEVIVVVVVLVQVDSNATVVEVVNVGE